VSETACFFSGISLNFISPMPDSSIQWGFFYGFGLSALLALSGYLALRWARNRSHLTFLGVLVGGFLFRLAVFGIVLVWVWKFSDLNAKVFTATLLVSYLFFQIVETVILQRYFRRMKSTS
jgi:hypothetical protein